MHASIPRLKEPKIRNILIRAGLGSILPLPPSAPEGAKVAGSALPLFLRIVLPLLALVLTGSFLYGQSETEHRLTILKGREALNVGLGAAALTGRMDGVSRDLRYLSGLRVLDDAVNDPRPENLARLAEGFASFVVNADIYDQLRWIDETGRERVRVDLLDGKPAIIAADRLQDKGKRGYFADGSRLKPGEIYVSPFDLNVEHERIEMPYKPTIRVATPVADGTGRARGIVILNYHGREMLEAFATATSAIADHIMLANAGGYWLKSSQAGEEWGFMFERPELSLAARAADAWRQIRDEDHGQMRLADGLWTWATVHPVLVRQKSGGAAADGLVPGRIEIEPRRHVLKSVAHLPADTLDAVSRGVWPRVVVSAAIWLSLLGFGSWKLAQAWTRQAALEAAVRQANAELEEKVVERTSRLNLAARVVDSINEAMLITDLNSGVVAINPAFERITGYSFDDVAGKDPKMLFPATADGETLSASVIATLRSGAHWQGELPLQRKNGEMRTISLTISRVEDDPETATHFVNVFNDITEYKKTDDSLRQISLAVEQSPESIVITNLAGEFEYANESFHRVSGYSRDEMRGQNLRIVGSGKTPRETFVAMWTALSQGQPWRGEFYNRHKNGTDYIEFAIVAPICQPGGQITNYVAIKEDISEKKRMGLELDQYRHHLESLVQERTIALSVARDAAEAADRAKSVFLANMSHELRTPMNAIMGMTRLALRRTDDPGLRDQLNKIDRASHHLLAVINNILDLSKIEAERLTLEQIDFNLSALLEHLTNMVGHKATEKNLKLLLDIPPAMTDLLLQGDPQRLSQILLNLTDNALKFTAEGSITLRARLAEDGPRDVLLHLDVQDTGIGIAAGDQKRLFTPFEQADGSMTRKYGGTGLGLAISKHLARMMNGDIELTSQPGAGSTFRLIVRLPKAAAAVPPASTSGLEAVEARLKARFAGTRILLAEDEPINREVTRWLLETAGFVVDQAEDGVFAVELARRTRYPLILMDIQMPNLNGIDATQAIRKLPGHEHTPILALTANAFAEDRQACLDAGMNDHIGKPVDPDLLYQLLEKWLAPARVAGRLHE